MEQRLEAVDNQAPQIEASVQQQMELASIMSSITEFCHRVSGGLEQATLEQKWQLGELLIDRVVVTNEEVETRYVIPTSSHSQQILFCHLLTDYLVTAYVALPVVRVTGQEEQQDLSQACTYGGQSKDMAGAAYLLAGNCGIRHNQETYSGMGRGI
jgi:site-specific DNA recombinase